MERAALHPEEVEHPQPQPVPRDPDLPTVSDTALRCFAAAALVVTLVALLILA